MQHLNQQNHSSALTFGMSSHSKKAAVPELLQPRCNIFFPEDLIPVSASWIDKLLTMAVQNL